MRQFVQNACLCTVLITGATILAACEKIPGTLQNSAVKAVRAEMSDPASTTFRNLSVIDGYVCGEFNTRNNAGGYEGYQRFFYAKDVDLVGQGFVDKLEIGADYIRENPRVTGITSDYDITGMLSDRAAAQCTKEGRWIDHCAKAKSIPDPGIADACKASDYHMS